MEQTPSENKQRIAPPLRPSTRIPIRFDNPNDLPEGAILLTEAEAVEAQRNLVDQWRPKEEVWPFIHGKSLIACVTGITGFVISGNIRAFYQLAHQKMLMTLVPSILAPCLITQVYHMVKVSNEILLGNTGCPACLSSRSGIAQTVFSPASSLVLASISGYAVANMERTFPLPTPWDYRGLGKLGLQILKSNRTLILGSFALNFAFGYWLSHKEMKAHMIMQMRLRHAEIQRDST